MKRNAVGIALLFVTVLTGCAGPVGASQEPATPPAEEASIPLRDDVTAYITKERVEGTELLCRTQGNYGSTSCNWELWNKTREVQK
ncbi:hypothetical protein [Pseudarthrobacter sp. BIM B-2242]|uniref:hypothetical protein n=1 Tax=Pseudarthrobacter sp. BIM B-2242 TaxID=2772401 RepID=UPI00168A4694|nr:hypothetical protein [Pseudarthrobacter sp. BIM B-2242]QOD05994.1 hypothetical protein IDT60_20730 [Pseudarthrobacter sp. BIM B-2242]